MASLFFKNLKVIELSNVLAGPAVGMFFAELGAEVIKVENKLAGGDITRKWKLPNEKTETVSAYFSSVNYKKKYLQIDFQNSAEKQEVINLIRTADIVIVNFKKGDDEKFGFTWKALSQLNSQLIYAHITGYGTGSEKTAFDAVLQAETGFMHMNGTPESGPVKMPVALIDILAAHQLKEAILLALLKRKETGKGAYVHCSLYEAAVSSLANQASNYLMTGTVAQPMGTLHPNIAPYGEILKTRDGKSLILAVGTDSQFMALCRILLPGTQNDPRFLTNTLRIKNRSQLHALLYEAAFKINADVLGKKLLDGAVPHGFIHDMAGVFENELAQNLIRKEIIDGVATERVSTIAFNTNFLDDTHN
ncbi:MAG TPA: CaiB/BaiF CoA-transferase family protein [Flavobacteriales bacterium]|nr:CaiB/BaiF CoA-transferase family protein [Flavobacteriales bacterium]